MSLMMGLHCKWKLVVPRVCGELPAMHTICYLNPNDWRNKSDFQITHQNVRDPG